MAGPGDPVTTSESSKGVSRFRVFGLGLGRLGSGCFGFRVQGLRFRVEGLGRGCRKVWGY